MGQILRATAMGGDVRLFATITTDIVEEARKIHNLSATSSAALGRLLTAGSMMGVMLKGDDDRLTLTIQGGGPAGNLVVAADSKGMVKGYMSNPQADLPPKDNGKLNVGALIGNDGFLTVIKDMGLKTPYTGKSELISGEIGDDLAYYFTTSEQTPSAVAVGVLVDKDLSIKGAGGLIIQMMPDSDEGLADVITYRLQEIPPLSTLISEGKNAEDILNLLFDDMDLQINERIETKYQCDCSRERIERALIAIGKKDLESLKKEQKNVEVQCHFCNKKYVFDHDDIDKLLQE